MPNHLFTSTIKQRKQRLRRMTWLTADKADREGDVLQDAGTRLSCQGH